MREQARLVEITRVVGTPGHGADVEGEEDAVGRQKRQERGRRPAAVSYTHLDVYKRQPQWLRSPPLADSMATISRLMSVGLTPLIRLACPSVRGLIWDSLTALSRRRPDVFI